MSKEPQGDPLAYFSSGQAFAPAAATLNAWQDAARHARGMTPGATGGAGRGFVAGGTILVKNNTGGNRLRGEVLQITSPVFDPGEFEHVIREEPYFLGVTPIDDYAEGVILVEPIPTLETGRAVLVGVCWGKVDFDQDDDKFAYFAADKTDALKSNPVCGNARILWHPGTTGVQNAVLSTGITPQASFYGTVTQDYEAPDAIEVHAGDSEGIITASRLGQDDTPIEQDEVVLCHFDPYVHQYYWCRVPRYEVQSVLTDVCISAGPALQFRHREVSCRYSTTTEDIGPELPLP